MDDMIYWIWLSILDLRPIEKIKLLEIFKTPINIYNLKLKELKQLTNYKELVEILSNNLKIIEAKEIYKYCLENNIKLIKSTDTRYPKKLKMIYDYPILIYGIGDITLLNSTYIASIVGTRKCSKYGKYITDRFSYLLAQKGYTIVSGMAKGIDTCAHMGALKATGKTIAVLGSGIDYIYPIENKKLYLDIVNYNGLIISEYPPKMRPVPYYFPMRNRIISGISDKVLVTEAGLKSGSIITANFALEQGKNVYAIPGNITNINSVGTNELLKDGAILVTSIDDIIN